MQGIDPHWRDVALGCVVRLLRERRGMTQGDLARAAGVAQPVISRMERGEVPANLANVRGVAGAFGVPVTLLIEWADEAAERANDTVQVPEVRGEAVYPMGWEVIGPEAALGLLLYTAAVTGRGRA